MKRGRRRKPTELRVIEGNRGHRPIPENEPKFDLPDSQPIAPDWLDEFAREEWDRVIPDLYAVGIIGTADTTMLANYCVLAGRVKFCELEIQKLAKTSDRHRHGGLVQETKEKNQIQTPLLGIANAARRDMVRIASEFGLTPSARANLKGAKGDGEDATEKKFF